MNDSNVHLTVATVIEHNKRYLMVKEVDNGRVVYNQPAGHWEAGEELWEAAIRETREETGCEVSIEGFLGLSLMTLQTELAGEKGNKTYCRASFSGLFIRDIPNATLDPDILATEWLTYEEICSLRDKMRSKLVIQTIDLHRRGERHCVSDIFTPLIYDT